MEFLERRVAPDVVVLFGAPERDHHVVEEAGVVSRRRFHVARQRELILVLPGDLEILGRNLHALAHRQACPRLRDGRQLRREESRSQAEPGRYLVHDRPAARAGKDDRAEFVVEDDRCVADRVGAAADA